VIERRTVHVTDAAAAVEGEYADSKESQSRWRYQTILAVALVRGGTPIGALSAFRTQARPFTDGQIKLMETFADQAVIAIENARLFQELQERTEDLTRSIDRLTALFEVGQAVGSTLDLDRVLQTVVARAAELVGADGGAVYEYDPLARAFDLRATDRMSEELIVALREARVELGQTTLGRAAASRQPIQVADILAAGEDSTTRRLLERAGYRSLLAVPLLREDEIVGALVVRRREPGAFAEDTIALLQTFAAQSALAIQNARLFQELADKSAQLLEASRHKSAFLANMSHELRTPLNAVIGYTELILDGIYGDVPERVLEVLERVRASGQHLLGLINAVLDLSKIEAGQLALTLAEYSPRELVRAVGTQVEPLAAAKGLRLRVEVPPDPPIGRGDERRLTQVLLNLVGNAIKFTDAGEVAVRADVADGELVVAVADTGPGIAEADRERVFGEFQQADDSLAREKGGTGLGLAIARRIVELHGGRIWLESELGRGSTFAFAVPLRAEVTSEVAPAEGRP
jgi:signal transduction histidine kinase